MKASWKPQVKKPSTSRLYDRWPNASISACRAVCVAAAEGAAAAPDATVRGVASARDSGRMNSTTKPIVTRAVCQPEVSISTAPSGENRNWPNEPAAVPAPNDSERQLSGSSLPNAAITMVNEQPD